jgi:hypothetical protein
VVWLYTAPRGEGSTGPRADQFKSDLRCKNQHSTRLQQLLAVDGASRRICLSAHNHRMLQPRQGVHAKLITPNLNLLYLAIDKNKQKATLVRLTT